MNKIKFTFVVICGLLNHATIAFGQAKTEIVYQIRESEIRMNIKNPIAEVTAQLINFSSINFILYGFDNVSLMPPSIDSTYAIVHASEGNAGNLIFILKGDGRAGIWENVESPHSDSTFGTDRYASSIRDRLKDKVVNATEVLLSKSLKDVRLRIDFSNSGPLEKGEYSFYLMYKAGELTKKIIGLDKVREDENRHKAICFQGFIQTNKVRLIIDE